ncbi:MAG: hypothetical protein BWY75_02977 [bacterium ADurb.Bin425]|nr:MAG: hypothetical protein BWY75_02977 [bacterium ADurb.Bin425]
MRNRLKTIFETGLFFVYEPDPTIIKLEQVVYSCQTTLSNGQGTVHFRGGSGDLNRQSQSFFDSYSFADIGTNTPQNNRLITLKLHRNAIQEIHHFAASFEDPVRNVISGIVRSDRSFSS